jgi:hypothetical protein
MIVKIDKTSRGWTTEAETDPRETEESKEFENGRKNRKKNQ